MSESTSNGLNEEQVMTVRRAPHIGTPEDYARYFREKPLGSKEEAMLISHIRQGILTMTEVARAAGWRSFRSGNARYGGLARKIREYLGLEIGRSESSGNTYHILSLAEFIGQNGEGEELMRLHPEVVEGARQAGIIA